MENEDYEKLIQFINSNRQEKRCIIYGSKKILKKVSHPKELKVFSHIFFTNTERYIYEAIVENCCSNSIDTKGYLFHVWNCCSNHTSRLCRFKLPEFTTFQFIEMTDDR